MENDFRKRMDTLYVMTYTTDFILRVLLVTVSFMNYTCYMYFCSLG